jgi:predicted DsbA family dithiol-disulfide isomerase
MKIDFVSDVSCPWCVIGLRSLQQALLELGDSVGGDGQPVALHFQPFELNPHMAPEGEDIHEHLARKYGASPAQAQATREMIRERGAALGFEFRMDQRARIYNTFDAHRLLHWVATLEGGASLQLALKQALFAAYFTDGLNPGSHEVLLNLAGSLGLDTAAARQVLDSDAFAAEVRAQEALWQRSGINSVPAIIINDRHLIQGGQPPEVFVQALRQIAAETQR